MAITFDLQYRFQENKVLQTAQTINNIIKSNKRMVAFGPMETVTFLSKLQKNTCLALIIQIMWLKENFLKKEQSYVNIREFKISQRGRGRERLETIHFNYIV